MRQPFDPLLWRLLAGGALFLPLSLAAWWWLVREPLAKILGYGVSWVSQWLWPESILGVGLDQDQGMIVSLLPPLVDSAQSFFMALPLPFNRATVILPLFWGLTLATPGRGLLRRVLLGTLILLPLVYVMVLLYVQFQLALYRTHLPLMTEAPPPYFALALPDSPLWYYLWGFGRQLAVLVLPVVAPLMIWLWLHGAFLRKIILSGLLHRSAQSTVEPSSASQSIPPLEPKA